jgi:hypothetical protein
MINAIDMITGAGLVFVGLVIGRFRRPGKLGEPKTVKYKCGCTHDLSAHDPKTKACTASIRTGKYNKFGDWVAWDYSKGCACKQYVGPKPLPDLSDVWPEAPKIGGE